MTALMVLVLAQVRYPAPPEDVIRDDAGLVSAEAAGRIREAARGAKAPIRVLTIKSLADVGAEGWSIERYASSVFAEWGIGQADRNTGMLLVVSPGDRRARIELGAGWGRQGDRRAESIMAERIVPEFRRGRFGEGIVAGVEGLAEMAGAAPRGSGGGGGGGTPFLSPNCGRMGSEVWILLAVVAVVFLFGRARRMRRRTWGRGGGYGMPAASGCVGGPFASGCLGAMVGNMLSGGLGGGRRHYGGGFGGSSSWGGSSRGGFSGGGGATGSW